MRDGILLLEDVDDGSNFPMRVSQLAELVGDHLTGGEHKLGKDRQATVLNDLHQRFGALEEAVAKYNRNEDVGPLVESHYNRKARAELQRVETLEAAVAGAGRLILRQERWIKWLALLLLAGSMIDMVLIAHVWR